MVSRSFWSAPSSCVSEGDRLSWRFVSSTRLGVYTRRAADSAKVEDCRANREI